MESGRQSMKRVRACDLVSARFFQGDRETMRPGRVVTGLGESVVRAKVVGAVVERFESDDGKFSSITVDDGTGAIRAKVFAEESRVIAGFGPGDLVAVVGKVKMYNEENYIAPDFVRRLDDPNAELLFRLEVLAGVFEKKRAADEVRRLRDQMSDEELQEYAAERFGFDKDTLQVVLGSREQEVDYRPMLLDIMDRLDEGKGVEIGKLLEASELDESMAESAVSDLISSGEVYEPTVGRLKRVSA